MNQAEIAGKLKPFIEEEARISISSNDDELDIDSFTMMLVITYVHEEFGVELELENMDFDAFNSLNTFANLVLEQAARSASAA
jgi:acyl carrier protein